jgi:alkanesulfonate monooxygenase SsuD/methylene tetrahydromethanopterin reductase-like flavin-dependent oxidoreductase (luciferase family)
MPLPAISLVAVPGRRRLTLEIARDIERRGYAGIYTPSMYGNMSQCEAMCWNTERIPFGTAIAPLYVRTVLDFAQSAAFMHEVSGGRFRLGIGVAHAPGHQRMGVTVGRPLGDTRAFIEKLRAVEGVGEFPPIIIAALRQKMVALAGEISQGVVFANAARSHMAASLSVLSPAQRDDPAFFIGNMLPICISDDIGAAKEVCRKNLIHYTYLPNYRNYWKEAGYAEEMIAIERAIEGNRRDDVPRFLTDRWLSDVAVFGPASHVRDEVEAWQASGVRTPVIVPSSASGGQLKALEEIFATFG